MAPIVALLAFAGWRCYEHGIQSVLLGAYDKVATCDGNFRVGRAEARDRAHGSVEVVTKGGQRVASIPVPTIRLRACLSVVDARSIDREAGQFEQALASLRQPAADRIAAAVSTYLDDRFAGGTAEAIGWSEVFRVGRSFVMGCLGGIQREGLRRCASDGLKMAGSTLDGIAKREETRRLAQMAESLRAVAKDVETAAERRRGKLFAAASLEHEREIVRRILRRNDLDVRFERPVETNLPVAACELILALPQDLPGPSRPAPAPLSGGAELGLGAGARQYREEINGAFEGHFGQQVAAWENCSAKAYRDHLAEMHKHVAERISQTIKDGSLVVVRLDP